MFSASQRCLVCIIGVALLLLQLPLAPFAFVPLLPQNQRPAGQTTPSRLFLTPVQIATPQQVLQVFAKPNTVILDVRSQVEIDNAGLIQTHGRPWVQLSCTAMECPSLPGAARTLFPSKSVPIIVHCSTGARAAKAKEILDQMGYKQVVNAGGFDDLDYLQSAADKNREIFHTQSVADTILKTRPNGMNEPLQPGTFMVDNSPISGSGGDGASFDSYPGKEIIEPMQGPTTTTTTRKKAKAKEPEATKKKKKFIDVDVQSSSSSSEDEDEDEEKEKVEIDNKESTSSDTTTREPPIPSTATSIDKNVDHCSSSHDDGDVETRWESNHDENKVDKKPFDPWNDIAFDERHTTTVSSQQQGQPREDDEVYYSSQRQRSSSSSFDTSTLWSENNNHIESINARGEVTTTRQQHDMPIDKQMEDYWQNPQPQRRTTPTATSNGGTRPIEPLDPWADPTVFPVTTATSAASATAAVASVAVAVAVAEPPIVDKEEEFLQYRHSFDNTQTQPQRFDDAWMNPEGITTSDDDGIPIDSLFSGGIGDGRVPIDPDDSLPNHNNVHSATDTSSSTLDPSSNSSKGGRSSSFQKEEIQVDGQQQQQHHHPMNAPVDPSDSFIHFNCNHVASGESIDPMRVVPVAPRSGGGGGGAGGGGGGGINSPDDPERFFSRYTAQP